MANLSENELIEQITDVGNRLFQPPKFVPELLNLLDEVEFILTKVEQAPPHPVQVALLIPMKALIADDLLRHSDPNVRITLASCLNEVTRITAPIPPFDDDMMRDIFKLMVSSFERLSCQPGRLYSKAVLILQSFARLRSCVMMLDLDCDHLVTKMFELFQRNISIKHPQSVLLAMVNIMSVMIQESDTVSMELLKVLLASIKMENQSVSPVSWELGVKILEGCTDKLRPFIMETVSSMGCCLEDYAPLLSSILKPELDSVTNGINDSSFLVSNETSGYPIHQPECVQALKAIEKNECTNVLGTGGVAFKRGRKQKPQNPDEETTDLQYVQAWESSENVECVDTLGTGRTASLRGRKYNFRNLEEPTETVTANLNASGVQYVQGLEAVEICEATPVDSVQALEVSESFELVKALGTEGTALKRVEELNSKNLDEESTGLEREQAHQGTADDDISKNNGITIKEETDIFENKQAYNSPALGDSIKRKRGRPRKNITGVSEDKVIETHEKTNYNDDLVGRSIKVWWPMDRRYYKGIVTLFDAHMRRHMVNYDDGDEEMLNLRKQCWDFISDETSTDIVCVQESSLAR